MAYCTSCGQAIPDTARFCTYCGYGTGNGAATGYVFPAASAPAQQVVVVQQQPCYLLKTNRSSLAFWLLSILTFGIYGLVIMADISSDINTIASRYDGKKTMNYALLFLVSLLLALLPLVLIVAHCVWFHRICSRIGTELCRRGIGYGFGAADYWIWGILGVFIFVGPFIFTYRLLKAMNLLSAHYNQYGC